MDEGLHPPASTTTSKLSCDPIFTAPVNDLREMKGDPVGVLTIGEPLTLRHRKRSPGSVVRDRLAVVIVSSWESGR